MLRRAPVNQDTPWESCVGSCREVKRQKTDQRWINGRYKAHITHNSLSDMVNAEAGPSRPKVKPKSPHPSHRKVKKLATRLPPKPTSVTTQTLPIKVLQGRAAARTDGTRHGYGREEVFVTRKVSLGALMGRCRSLVVDEG